jgi:hypothetical protein
MLEPFAMRRVDGIVTVSPAYSATLRGRYSWIDESMCATIPFGVSAADFEAAAKLAAPGGFFDRHDGRLHGVAVGRGGRDMSAAARLLVRAFQEIPSSGGQDVHLTFVGTDYNSRKPQATIAPVAASLGAPDLVTEFPARVPFLGALRLLADADFTIILGSDDAAYSPSKVYPDLAARRPFVAVLHEASPVIDLLRQAGTGVVATYSNRDGSAVDVARLARDLRRMLASTRQPVQPAASVLRAISAPELTRRQCMAFETALRHAAPQGVPCAE